MQQTKVSRTHLINRNGGVAGDLVLRRGARSENILYGSLNDEQRRCSAKDPQPFGLSSGGLLAALTPQSQNARLCSFVASCQPPARNSAHPVPIYEMGSKTKGNCFVSGAVDFEDVVFRAIDRVNELLPESSTLAKRADQPLAGVGSRLDSLGVVNLIVAVEEEVALQCNAEISLADMRANGANDPLETVGSLVRTLQSALGKP